MAFSINQITLLGNVAKTPELKYTPNGTAVCYFNMATNHSVKDGSGYKNVPTFHRVVCWRGTAEFVGKTLRKGDKVYVDGRMDNRSYEKDGQTRYTSEVVANNIIPMTDTRDRQPAESNTQPTREVAGLSQDEMDEIAKDIPF